MKIQTAVFKKGIRGSDAILYEQKPQIAFIGRSNVGKSSLINTLVNQNELVKSGKTPGKTKEINFFLINGDFYFVDLPGYGYARVSIEDREQLAKMIEWYFMEKVFNRTTVLVLDIKAGPGELDLELIKILREQNEQFIVVANKADSVNQKETSAQMKMISEKIPGIKIIPCSAKTKDGRGEILNTLFEQKPI